MKPKRNIIRSLSVALIFQVTAPLSYSATRFWDGTNADIVANGDATATNASGTWSTSIANWDQGNGLAHVVWNNAANDTAEFSGGTNTITLGSNVTVGRINQKGGGSGITIGEGSGPFTITLGAATTIFNVAASATVGRVMNVNAVVTGGNNLSIQGPATTAGGQVTLNRVNTFTGTLAIDDTTLSIGAAGQLNSGNYTNTISITSTGDFVYASALDQTLGGVISGAGTVTKNNATSTLTLFAANSFSGALTVNAGTLVAGVAGSGGNSALGSVSSSRTITVNTGGTLRFDVGNVFNNVFSSAATSLPTLNIAGGTLTNGGTATNSALGNITLTGGTITATTGSPLGTASGQGFGSWNLNGTITSTGTSTISSSAGGIPITLSASAANGFITTFDVTSGTLTASAPFGDVTRSGNETVSGLTKSGSGVMSLSGANTYSGTTTVSAGSLQVQHANALGATAAGTVVNGSGTGRGVARLEMAGGITVTGEALTISGGGNFLGALTASSGNNVWAGPVTIGAAGTRIGVSAGATLEVSGAIDSGLVSTGLTIRNTDGTGSVILSGVNTYLGNTQVLVGKLQLAGGDNRLPVATNLTFGSAGSNADSELDLNGRNQEVAGLILTGTATKNSVNNSDAVNLSTLTVNTAASSTFDGILKGNLALTKSGTDSLTLGGSNSYTGASLVSAGTLFVNGSLSASAVTVQSDGALGGAGTLGNGLTINAGGELNLTGASLAANSTGILSITGGSLTLGNLTFQDLVGWDWMNAAEGTYELIDGVFSIDFGSTAYLSESTAYDFGNGNKGYFTAGSLNAVIIAVPEPSAALLGSMGLLFLLRRRRG